MKPLGQQSVLDRPADPAAPADPSAPAAAPDVASPGGGRGRPSGRAEEPGAGVESRRANPEDAVWERLRRAFAERTVLTGVIRSRKPFGVFVNLGGIDGLVRTRELPAEDPGREAPGLQEGQTVTVVVIGMTEDTRRVELSMKRAGGPRTPLKERGATGPEARPAEGPMALAFRLAREKKKQVE